jgi:hypothetical protein
MYSSTLRSLRSSIGVLAMLAACSKGDQHAKVFSGTLAKPIDTYSHQEFTAFVKKLDFSGGQERARHCKGTAACDTAGSTKRIQVRVDAVTDQDSIGPSTLPPNGLVALRLLNKGDAREAHYGLASGAELSYYMIVQRDAASGKAVWRLEQVDSRAETHTKIAVGVLTGCGHPWKPGARADFKSCEHAAHGDSVIKMGLLLTQSLMDDPAWMQCDEGCCSYTP